jgi:selenocysteine lyase/cysteine desulfurase
LGAVSLFSIDQCDARWVEQELRKTHKVHVKFRQIRHISGLRVSPSIYTQKSDLCRFVEALKQVVASR